MELTNDLSLYRRRDDSLVSQRLGASAGQSTGVSMDHLVHSRSGLNEDLSLYPAILESMDVTVTFPEGWSGIPAGMPGAFEPASGGVATLNHRLHAGMPPAFL